MTIGFSLPRQPDPSPRWMLFGLSTRGRVPTNQETISVGPKKWDRKETTWCIVWTPTSLWPIQGMNTARAAAEQLLDLPPIGSQKSYTLKNPAQWSLFAQPCRKLQQKAQRTQALPRRINF